MIMAFRYLLLVLVILFGPQTVYAQPRPIGIQKPITSANCSTASGGVQNQFCIDTTIDNVYYCDAATCDGSGWVNTYTTPAPTATALAANPANCAADNFPLGVNASGVVEGCTSIPPVLRVSDCTTQNGVQKQWCQDSDDNSTWICTTTTCTAAGWVMSGSAGGYDACRAGAKGGNYDAATGLYGWTCGNYNWHGDVDVTQATASWYVTCAGPASTHPTCLDTETRLIGALHRVGVAA